MPRLPCGSAVCLYHIAQLPVTYPYYPHKYWTGCAKANSVDPDQTAPQEQSDQGLHCLPFLKQFFECIMT